MKLTHYLKIFSFLLLVVINSSCSSQEDEINKEEQLIGTWSWVSSSGGIAGTTYNPKTTGKTIDLKFTNDNKYFYYTNGSLTSQGTYTFESRNCIHDHTNKTVIIFSESESQMIEKIDALHLYISDDNYDGFGNEYIKK